MSIIVSQAESFIPEFWAAMLMTSLNTNAVASSSLCTNRDYEGDVRHGSKVHINTLMDPAVNPYSGGPLTVGRVQTSATELLISEGDYTAFTVKDVERVQAAGNLAGTATAQAGRKMLETADKWVASQMIADAGTKDVPVSIAPGANQGDALYDAIVDEIVTALDENKIPENQRFLVVTPRLKAMLLKSSKFIDASAYGSPDAIRNGEIGRFAGFTVQMTTNIPQTTPGTYDVDLIAGHPMATTYADQIQDVESLRDPEDFGDILRGLHVYGAKVIRSEALVTAKVTISA